MEDITEKEQQLLGKISGAIDLILQMDFADPEQELLSPIPVKVILENTDKLIDRLKHRATLPTLNAQATAKPPAVTTANQYLFMDVCEKFITERISGDNWQKKTRDAYDVTFRLFKDIVGNVPIESINAAVCRTFKDKIQHLPKNHSKIARYRDQAVSKLVAQNIPVEQRISTESANKHILRITSLLHWCVQQSYVDKNYMAGMAVRIKKSTIDNRQPFNADDLNQLFSGPIYTDGKMRYSYYFWLPLIGLYSGARIQEICQLELADIYEIDGILVFDINDNSETKRLKTQTSRRIIPVHNDLIALGLNRLLARRKRQKDKQLFPELHKHASDREGQSQPASKWFARHKTKYGFATDGVKAFHSFRHTFIDELKGLNTPEHITASLAGHAHENITYGTYGGKDSVGKLNEYVQRIDYQGFDYNHIRWHPK